MPPPPRPSRYDQQQDQQNQQQDQQIRNLQNRLTGVEADVVQQGEQVSSLQRLRIHIPNPYTHFLLGQRALSNPEFGYTGVSLQTDNNLFFDVGQDSVFQTRGLMLLQTQNRWQQYSQELMELSSPTAVKVVGAHVFLGAIETPQPPEPKPPAGEALEANTANELQPLLDHLSEVARRSDIVANALGLIYTGVFLTKPEASFLSWTQMAETLYVSWKGAKSIYDALNPSSTPGDVNIYGQGGVNVLSPASIQLTTTSDLKSFASGDTTFTSQQYSTLQAGIGAKCFGGLKSTVEAGGYAEVKAGSSVSIASLRGQAEVKGKNIAIGRHLPDLAQVATQKIELKATQNIALDSLQGVEVKSGESTEVEAGENFKVKAEKAVQIQVGAYCIEVKPDGIKIGKGSNGKPSNPIITIKDENITILSSGMGVKVSKTRTSLGKSGNLVSVTTAGNVLVKGKKVKLG
ncbi:MAG TPA: hypothetical protein VNA24_22735 [Hyalangium sp.]|nr:hypothetical protein [Hyalangium sp.]